MVEAFHGLALLGVDGYLDIFRISRELEALSVRNMGL